MSIITIRLTEHLLSEVSTHAQELHIKRAEYIRKALELMNQKASLDAYKKKLTRASKKVRGQSMAVNAEFSEIEHDPEV